MRTFLTIAVPFLLPTLLYMLWLVLRARVPLGGAMPWQAFPWPWLVISGVVLTALFLYLVNFHIGGAARGKYVPPQYIDGRVVPGHVAPPDAAGR